MPKIDEGYPKLTGGVSQQSPQRRLRTQSEDVTNAWLSEVKGFGPRGPLRHIGKLRSGDPGDLFVHTLDRDVTERYSIQVRDGEVKAYDIFDGTEVPVRGPRRNHLQFATDFSNSVWSGGNVTRTMGQPDPSGGTGAWKLSLDLAVNLFVRQDALTNFLEDGEDYVFWTAIQYGNSTTSQVDITDTAGTSTALEITWNYDPGTGRIDPSIKGVSTLPIGSGPGTHEYGLELLEDNWVYVWCAMTYAAPDNMTVRYRPSTTAPSVGDYINVWRPMLERTTSGRPSFSWVNLAPAYAADFSYLGLSGEDPRDQIRAATVGDFSFFLNRTVEVKKSEVKTGQRRHRGEALLFVKQGGVTRDYYFKITQGTNSLEEFVSTAEKTDGSTKYGHCVHGTGGDSASCTASGGLWVSSTVNTENWVPSSDNTSEIAQHIAKIINDAGLTWVSATAEGPTVHVVSDDAFDEIIVDDSEGGSAFSVIHKSVEELTDLPVTAPHGMTIKITGAADEADAVDGYFVTFESDGGAGTFGKGGWRESAAAHQRNYLDETTMPHTLVRRQDNASGNATGMANQVYFEFAPFTWCRREVGDDISNPFPEFVTPRTEDPRKIDAISAVEGRLLLVSKESLTFSEVNILENLWRSTVTVVPDSDRISVSSASPGLNLFKHIVPLDERTVLMSPRAQFVVSGSPLTSASIALQKKLEFPNFEHLQPVSSGRGVFFGFPRGSLASADSVAFSGVQEMFSVSDVDFTSQDITDAVPEYIEGRLRKLSASTSEGVMVCITGDDSSVYVYNYRSSGGQDIQSAWSKWDFGDQVIDVEFVQSDLVVTMLRSDGVYLEMLTVGDGITDPDSAFLVRLDRKIDESSLSGGTYSALTDSTTFTLPYTVRSGATMRAVTRAVPGSEGGVDVPVESASGTTLVLTGDQTGTKLWVGELFTSTLVFTSPYLRDQNDSPRTGQQMIVSCSLSYSGTAAFDVLVAHEYGQTFTEHFDAHVMGTGSATPGVVLDDGEFTFLVGGEPDKVTVSVSVATPLPCNIVSAEWRFNYIPRRSRR